MKRYKLTVKVDTNDADYMESSSIVSENFIAEVKSRLAKLDRNVGMGLEDYEVSRECVAHYNMTEDDKDWWKDFLPTGEITYGYSSLS